MKKQSPAPTEDMRHVHSFFSPSRLPSRGCCTGHGEGYKEDGETIYLSCWLSNGEGENKSL